MKNRKIRKRGERTIIKKRKGKEKKKKKGNERQYSKYTK